MALPIEFYSIIIPIKILEEKYQGGLVQYIKDCPNMSFLSDQHITRVGFMDPTATKDYCYNLATKGLEFDVDKTYTDDFVVVQYLEGKVWKADWLQQSDDGNYVFFKS